MVIKCIAKDLKDNFTFLVIPTGPLLVLYTNDVSDEVHSVLLLNFLHREQRDPQYLRDKLSQKHSKEQFEAAQKIEQDYSRFFTGWCEKQAQND